jgi:hypothetical protein
MDRGGNSAVLVFEDFKTKPFASLWRGSRGGFGARAFHSHCDGHSNTLTLILDTTGNVFGGFTPVMWESRERRGNGTCDEADPSPKSFVFTLKNPHNVQARRLC